MATKTGYPLASKGLLTDVDTTTNPRNVLGTRQFDDLGNEFIYLQGIGSTVIGSVVTFGLTGTNAYLTALSVTGARGPVAFALAAVLAGQWGWYQIFGQAIGLYNASAVAGTLLFSASTGKCDDAVVTGDRIEHAIVGATVASGVLGSVFCSYPFMNGNG